MAPYEAGIKWFSRQVEGREAASSIERHSGDIDAHEELSYSSFTQVCPGASNRSRGAAKG